MSSTYMSPRRLEREKLPITLCVECRESEDSEWKELAQTLDVSPFGARFQITRPTEPGRLLHLTVPLPRRLRCYDHDEEHYRIWSLVRHIRPLSGPEDEWPPFEIGVAFTGKDAPPTHETDPGQRFEILPRLNETGLWQLRETTTPDAPGPDSGERRSETRHNLAHEVVIEIFDAEGRVSESEVTRTENISRHGMAALTNLTIARGRYVRVRSAQYQLAVIAAVRRLGLVDDGRRRLHLEFVDQQWPPL